MKKIAIHSAPRSGSTWLGSIFDSNPHVAYKFQPLFSYAFKNRIQDDSNAIEISSFWNDLLKSDDSFINQNDKKEKGIIPEFDKSHITHIVYKEVRYHNVLSNMLKMDKEMKLIALVRNPFAVINSWLKAPKEFRADLGWDELEEWRFAKKKNNNQSEEFNGFEKWKELNLLFHDLKIQHSNRVYILNYNDLLLDTTNTIKKLFQFCELSFEKQTEEFLNESTSHDHKDAYSVFKEKSKDDEWKSTLNEEIISGIKKELTEEELEKYFR